MVSNNGSFVMMPKWKGKQIDSFTSWLHIWGLCDQVLIKANLYHHFKLTHYQDYIMKQDRKLTWQAVYTHDIQFRVKCAHDGKKGCNNYHLDKSTFPNCEHTSATIESRRSLHDIILKAQSLLHLSNFHYYLVNHPYQAWYNELLQDIE